MNAQLGDPDEGLSDYRCPACLCLVPGAEIVQRYGIQMCEDCAMEQATARREEEQQRWLTECAEGAD